MTLNSILFPRYFECWDYGWEPPHLAYIYTSSITWINPIKHESSCPRENRYLSLFITTKLTETKEEPFHKVKSWPRYVPASSSQPARDRSFQCIQILLETEKVVTPSKFMKLINMTQKTKSNDDPMKKEN